MGIRFLCEHCQKRLNVKLKQAGELCVCPDCNREIQIPLESTIDSPAKSRTQKKKRRGSKGKLVEVDLSPVVGADADATASDEVSRTETMDEMAAESGSRVEAVSSNLIELSGAAELTDPFASAVLEQSEQEMELSVSVPEETEMHGRGFDSSAEQELDNPVSVDESVGTACLVSESIEDPAGIEEKDKLSRGEPDYRIARTEIPRVLESEFTPVSAEEEVKHADDADQPTEPESEAAFGDEEKIDSASLVEDALAVGDNDITENLTDADSFLLSKPKVKIEDDPLRSDPKLVWYLRHKRLGEKGPLKARQVESMLESGQIREGHIVWREDWNDWLPAQEVFTELVIEENDEETSESLESVDLESRRKLRAQKRFWMCFNAAAFLLVVLLVYWVTQFGW